jgi:hypothetical protein
MDREVLLAIAQNQREHCLSDDSISGYISKCRVMINMLYDKNDDNFRHNIFEFGDDDKPLYHTGGAFKLMKLRLPIELETAQILFAALSIDETLPKKKRVRRIETNEDTKEEAEEHDPLNPAKNKQTVSAQTYQNYKSALKWWHEYSNVSMNKVGHLFPQVVDAFINKQIDSYKRLVGKCQYIWCKIFT